MGWFSNTLNRLKEAAKAEPLDCPRGWGSVSFVTEIGGFWPFFAVERKCPISGSSQCASCKYPFQPGPVESLRSSLETLTGLRDDRILTEEEFLARRRHLIGLQDLMDQRKGQKSAREGYRAAAWILGPIGILVTALGVWLGQSIHPGLFGVAGGGVVLLALTLSFAALSRSRKSSKDFEADGDPRDQF